MRSAARSPTTPRRPRTVVAGGNRPGSAEPAGRPRSLRSGKDEILVYDAKQGVDGFARDVFRATPLELVDTERFGVHGRFLRDLAARLDLPAVRVMEMVGVPKATAAKKMAANEVLSGSGGQAALGMAKLIAKAEEIVANSTAPEAKDFDAAKWLGRWLETEQPALAGRTPGSLLDTPTGVEVVLKLLGALESGAYQ